MTKKQKRMLMRIAEIKRIAKTIEPDAVLEA